ncbi:TetR/AcrR family transcriptional regulator [Celeribacter neptunius]|uniref:Transcriptional regulator, TetR family n=1 Tax=Celeribacter neptunius TaxID=588602 RepID=A0A1I3UA24_9RHOB|nr:TetR/AcrR family transcriptional regulator [Celeribacter neptunius]SFJ79573.1 transcriptional regulator, TetR family [Celeribacter neptunius]
MRKDTDSERALRGSPEIWLDAAYEALIETGVDSVKIMPLATTLNLSRTSFYWFFKNRDELLAALLGRWETTTTHHLVAATTEYAATETEAMLNVISTFLSDSDFDTKLELAIRNWAQQDPHVQNRLLKADQERLNALRDMLERWGHEPQDADVRARTIYLVQLGYISTQVQEDITDRLERFPQYVEIYTGKRPPIHEMERFKARIGYTAPPGGSTPVT